MLRWRTRSWKTWRNGTKRGFSEPSFPFFFFLQIKRTHHLMSNTERHLLPGPRHRSSAGAQTPVSLQTVIRMTCCINRGKMDLIRHRVQHHPGSCTAQMPIGTHVFTNKLREHVHEYALSYPHEYRSQSNTYKTIEDQEGRCKCR